MFSQRTGWRERLDSGAALPAALDLTVTNPSAVGLGWSVERLEALLAGSVTAAYEPNPKGLLAARVAVAAYHNHAVPPDHVVLAASTSELYGWIFATLCNPGDDVLVPTPGYPLFEMLARLHDVRLVPYACPYADGWHLDLDAVHRAVGPRTRAILAVSPNNPTGHVLRRPERDGFADLCARHDLALVVDEVFADFVTGPADPDRVASSAGFDRCLTFVLSGLSKVCLLPQAKLAWVAVSGPRERVAEALRRLELVADVFLSVASPIQRALPVLLAARAEVLSPLQARVATNRQLARDVVRDTAWSALCADGGWAIVLRGPAGATDDASVDRWLRTHGVRVHPGWYYDFSGEGWLVASAIVPTDILRAGLAAIVAPVP
ncbi:MAG: pyridoxal phosphate-dependent aminotransferase [Myxococcales bacterium]|nr:pyridoxal phosphate-dependent aminotransferase [Myxococcales bacterium]